MYLVIKLPSTLYIGLMNNMYLKCTFVQYPKYTFSSKLKKMYFSNYQTAILPEVVVSKVASIIIYACAGRRKRPGQAD